MPASPEARLDALRLVNAEIDGRIEVQRTARARVETKLQAVVGFSATGAAFLAAGDLGGVPIWGVVALVLAAILGLCGLWPREQAVVPAPKRMTQRYSTAIQQANPEEVQLAAIVPTKVKAFEESTRIDKQRVRWFQSALVLLVAGVAVAIVTFVWWDGGRLQEPTGPVPADAGA